MKSLEYSTKLKANFKKVKLERDELIAKLDEANNLNEKFKNQISSQVDKLKSLEEQLVEFKIEVEKLTSVKLAVKPNSKENDFYIPSFKRNNKELKANFARIDKGKISDVKAEVSKPMSKTPPRLNKNLCFCPTCHRCHIVGHIRQNCPKLRFLSTSKIRPPSKSIVIRKLLMFVTIVVFLVTLVLIVSSCFLISMCQIGTEVSSFV